MFQIMLILTTGINVSFIRSQHTKGKETTRGTNAPFIFMSHNFILFEF